MILDSLMYCAMRKARNNRCIYSVIHYFRTKKKERRFKKSLENFHKNGYEAMLVFDKCMVANGYKYSLAFGTLLGTIRNHDFIPHDDDIDVAMWINDYDSQIINVLKEAGIRLLHSYSVAGDKIGKELTFIYKGVHIDIFFFFKDEQGKAYCCDFIAQPDCSTIKESIYRHGGLLPRKIYVPLNETFIRTNLRDIEVAIPSNFEDILICRYGRDYMTPKKGWRPRTSSIIEIPSYVGVVNAISKD